MPTRPIDAHRAGRFILTVADDDPTGIVAMLREIVTDPDPTALLAFMVEQAAITIGLAQQHVGEGWQQMLSMALLDAEAEHLGEGGSASAAT